MKTAKKIEHLCIIGVGLIGGSFARAIRQAGLVNHITGCGRNIDNLQTALSLGVIDDYSQDVKQAVKDADVIFIATPVGSFQSVLSQLKDAIKKDAIITDGGSTKSSVIEAAEAVFNEVPENFVPGHPIAGTENSGVEASFATLYHEHRVILTPLKQTNPEAIDMVTRLWESAGAQVITMDAHHHDLVLAATSHLPHLLAFSLVNTLTTLDEKQEIFENAAGGFRDFTRIASSDPSMWQDICLANKDALLEHLDHFSADLNQLRFALKQGDGDFLKEIFIRAKKSRDDFVARKFD
ncbi:MAG: prephenate dehydrogenase/arogenate dehydrogenase family protein [gamma proteobacterium symbiont of Bathyaustriella thionipta]|nr:prephenate dehydrogenase/arogenate dehydrogenase family protein [gamma proteobacterium symbiont of Bathyaustriella thionipta]MCU7949237.1 prephenate dehydrogenase/arogenate dehydrogenase family protein [gamma proteobacterium symbiont of Bathyaustriella thionipta]MCU7954803.1 prephenate dehydrogenase/arogenate dehydrogenase family protein [gamma proteobacterium symbiont of Bathyaustriella thionipta]MCU7955821.1 prephenate dehydrogenase/arogenate dehydrogenase family protein [gamma proteobacter